MKKLFYFLLLCPLFIACSSDDDDNGGNTETISTYSDVKMEILTDKEVFFSTKEGKILASTEITTKNAASVDLVFSNMATTMLFFQSPLNSKFNVEGFTSTVYRTVPAEDDSMMNNAIFDAIKKSEDLQKYNFAANNESFGRDITPIFILFRNASNKTGVIKVKEIVMSSNKPYIVCDIKVQK